MELRVYDAVITTKLLYGLESASLSNTDNKRLDAFQNKGFSNILGIKHAYFFQDVKPTTYRNSQPRSET